jgi:hypothetical protein
MRERADEITCVRDVLRLATLGAIPGECIAVAIADLVNEGSVGGACGAGRVRAVERPGDA